MLHNLCRYILYVCRYIAQYISMANESNLKSGRDGKDIVRRGAGGLAVHRILFRDTSRESSLFAR